MTDITLDGATETPAFDKEFAKKAGKAVALAGWKEMKGVRGNSDSKPTEAQQTATAVGFVMLKFETGDIAGGVSCFKAMTKDEQKEFYNKMMANPKTKVILDKLIEGPEQHKLFGYAGSRNFREVSLTLQKIAKEVFHSSEASQTKEKDYDEMAVRLSNRYLKDGNYRDAKRVLLESQGLCSNETLGSMLTKIVESYLAQGKLDEAISLINQINSCPLHENYGADIVKDPSVEAVMRYCEANKMYDDVLEVSKLIRGNFDRGELLGHATKAAVQKGDMSAAIKLANAIQNSTVLWLEDGEEQRTEISDVPKFQRRQDIYSEIWIGQQKQIGTDQYEMGKKLFISKIEIPEDSCHTYEDFAKYMNSKKAELQAEELKNRTPDQILAAALLILGDSKRGQFLRGAVDTALDNGDISAAIKFADAIPYYEFYKIEKGQKHSESGLVAKFQSRLDAYISIWEEKHGVDMEPKDIKLITAQLEKTYKTDCSSYEAFEKYMSPRLPAGPPSSE